MAGPTDEQIRTHAYQLWEVAGKPDGRQDDFWQEAERELRNGENPEEKSGTFLE
jgi:Protein of unknown function (DUF2934)